MTFAKIFVSSLVFGAVSLLASMGVRGQELDLEVELELLKQSLSDADYERLWREYPEYEGRPKALMVEGNIQVYGKRFDDKLFGPTIREAINDLQARGYETYLLRQPSYSKLVEKLQDPKVTAFVFVGHGQKNNDGLKINSTDMFQSSDVMLSRINCPPIPLVILHSCFQGSFATKWRTAFGCPAASFHSWNYWAQHTAMYYWQRFWF